LDRAAGLQELPGWTWDAKADLWEEGFRRLQRYVERHGNARVAKSYAVDGYPLGSWAHIQRGRDAKGLLDADRQRRLQELPGWTWDPFTDQWNEGFSRLLDYIEQNRVALVPNTYTLDGYRLGRWVNHQRVRHAKGTLNAEHERRLQDVPGWTWDARDYIDRWEDGFNRLLHYVELNGNARVPSSYTVDGYPPRSVGHKAARQPRKRHPQR
jgi:hypothetical protein